ncbi:hypothetical protein JOC77_002643 [Peribacillus deserti]|uniref:Uncharacterized protein n=1 Tax=Peribacillus deserti TaxID=673318 RepID=A0ABS2QL71_9BACI|nr:hypothetical protein [Peribacillus deserti]MBM7693203.1 hypothetical protein [Peribacillus deserti]
MIRESFSILSVMFFALTLLFWFYGGRIFHLNGQQGTNMILMFSGISLVFALAGKGKWRFVTLVGLPVILITIIVLAILIFM